MSLSDLNTVDTIEAPSDNLGGGGYVWESGVYPVLLDLVYTTTAASGAVGMNIVCKDKESRELRKTLWVQSGNSKGNKTTYTKDGKEFGLPGFNVASAISKLVAGKELKQLDSEKKTVKLYDFDLGKEVLTEVDVYPELHNQRVDLGIIKQIVDKNVKDAMGNWVASGDTRDENEIDAVFSADSGLTLTETMAKATTPEFQPKWAKKWTGVTREKAKGKAANGAAPMPTAAATAPTQTGLFD